MNRKYLLLLVLILFSGCLAGQNSQSSGSAAFLKSLEGKSVSDLYGIASRLYDSDSFDKAVVAFQRCIDNNYKKDTCFFKQGVSYIGMQQSDVGIGKLLKAVEINPGYFKAWFALGVASYDKHEFQKSIAYYRKALKLEPKDDKVYYGIAASQFVLGQMQEAELNCKAALKFNSQNENAKTLLIRIQKGG